MSIPVFPTLFGESSHGKRKVWSIAVRTNDDGHGIIVTSHGYEDGKQVVNERVVTEGKNLGKKNATTPITQAVSEAQAVWKKKRDAGYVEDSGSGSGSGSAAPAAASEPAATAAAAPSTTAAPLPMLAHDFNKRGKSMPFPCFAQRKLDGVRCIAISGVGLFSRTGKLLSPHLTHITKELPAGTILDGELYSDDITFQEIVGLVKKLTLRPADAEKLQTIYLCVYDVVRENEPYSARMEYLNALFASNTFSHIRQLPTVSCTNLEETKTLHAAYVAEGYEGLILRNPRGLYKVGHRSADLQKYKEFEDAEYVVSGFREGDGVEKGCVIWICKTKAGQEFAVRPRGTHEERIAAYATAESMIGKELTVRFQELTNDGIPRFPVGIAFRDYE